MICSLKHGIPYLKNLGLAINQSVDNWRSQREIVGNNQLVVTNLHLKIQTNDHQQLILNCHLKIK